MSKKLAIILMVMMVAFIAVGYGTGSDWAVGFGGGMSTVLVAYFVEQKLRGRARPGYCDQATGKSHACALPPDGHTMHRCAFGDCSWGY